MAITNISRDWGTFPSIVRITTTDSLATITLPGYLTAQAANIFALNNGPFQWTPTDFVAISYAGGKGIFNVDYLVNDTFSLLNGIVNNVSVTVTSAQLLAMSATPVLIIPAQGAHTWIVAQTPIAFEYDYGTAAYAAGGAIGLEYGNTALLAGTAASSTLAAATFNGFVANNGFTLNSAATGTMASMVNLGIYLSNATAAFTTGNGTLTVDINYSVYNTTA
jgi:hypothetical protein